MVQSYYPSYLKLMKPYYPSYLKLMKPLLQRSRCNYGTASTTSRSSLDSFWIWSSPRFLSLATIPMAIQPLSTCTLAYAWTHAPFRRTEFLYYSANYRRLVPWPTWSRSSRAPLIPRPEVSLKLGGVEV